MGVREGFIKKLSHFYLLFKSKLKICKFIDIYKFFREYRKKCDNVTKFALNSLLIGV